MKSKIFLRILLIFSLISIIVVFNIDLQAEQEIMVIGWNAESGDANPDIVANRIEEIDGCDIWGICEVLNSSWASKFEDAAEVDENAVFESILGSTGGGDRMQIIYDSDRLELLSDFELHRINVSGTVRSPLTAHFKIKGTNIEFLFIVNHLYRTKSERRYEQARLLNCWASKQNLPIIAVGDYNFDWDVDCGDLNHDKGYDEMIKNGHFNWIQPKKLKKTQANPNFNSVLDFIFLGGNSWTWKAKSSILQRDINDILDNHLTDDDQMSDHRPVQATITIE